MRIIAGKIGGQLFKAPRGRRTHPMSDRIKGAIFNSLGNIEGLSVLDAFAGSGSLSYESVSRGASLVVAVESDKRAIKIIKDNIEKLRIENTCKIIHANVSSWSSNNKEQTFDIVIADPPYDNLRVEILQKLTRHIKDDGYYILSWPVGTDLPKLEGITLEEVKQYSGAQIAYYTK
ncbi:MAG: RsmD family RNA methyltransferase [Candidatus Saccharibacteria bacterium]|nr:RsmD family RNA methyltransferase [Candidatus Saccharibacteria bacterium]